MPAERHNAPLCGWLEEMKEVGGGTSGQQELR